MAKRKGVLGAALNARQKGAPSGAPDTAPENALSSVEKDDKAPSKTTFSVMSKQSAKKSRPGGTTHLVDTSTCVMWEYADRHVEGLDTDSLLELGKSILHNKQLAPAVARPVTDEIRNRRGLSEEIRYEIIAGRRRFEACKLVKTDLLVAIHRVDDATAFSMMVAENDDREDILPFTRALSFKAALDAGIYSSQSDLARHQEKDHSTKSYDRTTIGRMVKAALLSEREWFWNAVSSLDYASLPISLCHQVESAIQDNPKIEEDLIVQAGKYQGTDATALLKRLHSSALASAPDTQSKVNHSTFSVGKYKVDIGLSEKGAKLNIKGSAIKEDTIDDLLASIKAHLLKKL
jgi:ParB/RepB/Spo0J family partition protein